MPVLSERASKNNGNGVSLDDLNALRAEALVSILISIYLRASPLV